MVSGKQREFNKYMDGYLKRLPKHRFVSSQKVFFGKKKQEPEILEEHELERADEGIGKRSFLSKVYDFFFSSEAKVITEEELDSVEEIEPEPVKERNPYVKSLIKTLWGEKHEVVEEPEIRKVVLIKPAVEQELKFVLKLMDSLLDKVHKRDRERFLESREYKVYQKIKRKHS